MPVHDWTRVEAGVFHGFHTSWAVFLGVRLNQMLPSNYYAMVERKAFGWEPDVLTLGRGGREHRNGSSGRAVDDDRGGGVGLATAPPLVEFVVSRPASSRQRHVAIRRSDDDRIVAIIEIVSPGNKGSANAFQTFLTKLREFLDRGVNLLIVDLFPPTPRDPDGLHAAIWDADEYPSPRPAKPLTLATYQAGDELHGFVRSVAVGDVLPDMPLYLEPDRYIPVPLEETYAATFDGFARPWREVLTAPADGGGA